MSLKKINKISRYMLIIGILAHALFSLVLNTLMMFDVVDIVKK